MSSTQRLSARTASLVTNGLRRQGLAWKVAGRSLSLVVLGMRTLAGVPIASTGHYPIMQSSEVTHHHIITPTLPCRYHIEVKTSDVRGAGTDANVTVQVFGLKGDTGVQKL